MAENIRDFAVFISAIVVMCLLGFAARYFLLPWSGDLATLAGIMVPIVLYIPFRLWMRRR
jgi:hypothetical protein